MGYEDFSGKKFSLSSSAGAETPEREPAEGQDCSWGKLNLLSAFLQEIGARAVPFGRLNPKATRSR
jgi:hypothetical protein